MTTVLSLDMGATSIGWALLKLTDNKIDEFIYEGSSLIDAGSRVFEAGVDNLGQGSKEASRAVDRRLARGMRRNYERRRLRLRRLTRALQSASLLPKPVSWAVIYDAFGVKGSDDLANPYYLRTKALDHKLEPYELGIALYHLARRRGFKSNRKTDNPDEKGAIFDGSKNSQMVGIKATEAGMQEGKYRTLGEYLNSLRGNPNVRLRARYTQRAWYQAEFQLIWASQQAHYPTLLTDKLGQELQDIMFHQRPLKSAKHLIGKCEFERNKRRAPISHPVVQYARMLQQVSSLKLTITDTIAGKGLVEYPFASSLVYDDKGQIAYEASGKAQVVFPFPKVRDWRQSLENYLLSHADDLKTEELHKKGVLDYILKDFVNTENNDEGKKVKVSSYSTNLDRRPGKLKGCTTRGEIRKIMGDKAYENLDDKAIEDIWQLLYNQDNEEHLIGLLQRKYGVSAEQAQKLSAIKLPDGYSALSLKAWKKIIPHLEQGLVYSDACKAAGYNHSDQGPKALMRRLPKPVDVANPVVRKAMNELRKVINTILDRYPGLVIDEVRIEMGRDLGNAEDREEINKRQKENEAINDELRRQLIELQAAPTTSNLKKFKLFTEAKRQCMYCGKTGEMHQVLGDSAEFQTEHIIPMSRSLDDSMANKTIACYDCNAEKGDRTPHEWMITKDSAFRERFLTLIERLPKNKQRKMTQKETPELEGFISTQLNDTRYISRLAREYIQHICPNVVCSKGHHTATIRGMWQLSELLDGNNPHLNFELAPSELKGGGKVRLDHRHHALDAIVIGFIDRKMLQALAKTKNRKGKTDSLTGARFGLPWRSFKQDVKEMLSRIIVSHAVSKDMPGLSTKRTHVAPGSLHDGTNYGKIKNPESQVDSYVVRKDVNRLSAKEVDKIVDPVVRKVVQDAVAEFGLGKLPEIYHPNGQRIRSARITKESSSMVRLPDGRHVEPGNNHHVAVFRLPNGKQKVDVVSLWDVCQRFKNGQPAIDRHAHPGGEFLYYLMRNELFFPFTEEEQKDPDAELRWRNYNWDDKTRYADIFSRVYRVQKFSDSYHCMRHHTISKIKVKAATGKEIEPGRKIYADSTLRGLKLKIDAAGYLSLADE